MATVIKYPSCQITEYARSFFQSYVSKIGPYNNASPGQTLTASNHGGLVFTIGNDIYHSKLPPGDYAVITFDFSSNSDRSTTESLRFYLINGRVDSGTTIQNVKEMAIEGGVEPTYQHVGTDYDYRVTFRNFSIPYKYDYETSTISIYVDSPDTDVGIVVYGNFVRIQTSGDDSFPQYSVTAPIGQSYEYTDSVDFLWTLGGMPANHTKVTTRFEYSSDNGDNWRVLFDTTNADNGVALAANRFGVGQQNWRVSGSTFFSNGYGPTSDGNFSITAPLSVATPVYPLPGVYRDRKAGIDLRWSASNTAPSYDPDKTDIQWKTENGQWTDLATVTGKGRYYYVPANTFSHDVIYWRVRAYNQDDLPGDWSDAFYFTTIDAETTATVAGPKNNAGVNETLKVQFSWNISNQYGNDHQSGALLEYKEDGGTWATLATISDSSRIYYAPANFFLTGKNYVWRVTPYNLDNVQGISSEGTFNTIDTPQDAGARVPKDTIEDADLPILFKWNTYSQSGEVSHGADLQYSTNNSTWINFGPSVESGPQIVGNVHEYEAPAHTIPPGVIYWRVRSYNRNLVAGDWSSAISFVARAAPTVQDIGVTTKPWAIVNWQADDQKTYEVFVDGKSVGSYFGAVKQYQLPDYLTDGEHTVGVRVLGSFGLWSQINAITVTIENSPETAIAAKARTNVDVELTWEGNGSNYYVYRDGLMIGHTNRNRFTDRTALGVHEYRVIERLVSGDYNASAVLTRTPGVDCQHIAALAGGEWIAIPHTLKSQSDPSYQESQEVEYNYLSGSDYPIASIGGHRTDSGTYSAVFLYTEQDEHKRFLALRGKPVIFKTADGEVMIGILHAFERKPKLSRDQQYYTAYTFSVQRIGWEDFIDDTV